MEPRRRIYWPTIAFMAGFTVLIVFISNWYLLPAMEAASKAEPSEKRHLAAHARLLLAIVLVILVAGILLTFRFGRFFLPRQGDAGKPTRYVDAWEESARRVSADDFKPDKADE